MFKPLLPSLDGDHASHSAHEGNEVGERGDLHGHDQVGLLGFLYS